MTCQDFRSLPKFLTQVLVTGGLMKKESVMNGGINGRQGYGRSVRSKDDWATTYVIDSAFGPFVRKNKNILPHWFIQAIQPHLDAPLGQAPFETVKVLTPSEEHRNKITINHHNPTNIPEQNENWKGSVIIRVKLNDSKVSLIDFLNHSLVVVQYFSIRNGMSINAYLSDTNVELVTAYKAIKANPKGVTELLQRYEYGYKKYPPYSSRRHQILHYISHNNERILFKIQVTTSHLTPTDRKL
jgi:hypothetical protein